jgi:hypothetical protein
MALMFCVYATRSGTSFFGTKTGVREHAINVVQTAYQSRGHPLKHRTARLTKHSYKTEFLRQATPPPPSKESYMCLGRK